MESSDDCAKVIQVLEQWHDGLSLRLIASVLGWGGGRRNGLNTARVHRALLDLAMQRKVEQVNKKWRIKRNENKEIDNG